jgi:hypothetical protein
MRWSIRDQATTANGRTRDRYSEQTDLPEVAVAEAEANQPRSMPMSEQPKHSGSRSFDIARDEVDSASYDSFPASDPPKWSGLRAGPPAHVESVPKVMEEANSTSVQAPSRVQRREEPNRMEGLS